MHAVSHGADERVFIGIDDKKFLMSLPQTKHPAIKATTQKTKCINAHFISLKQLSNQHHTTDQLMAFVNNFLQKNLLIVKKIKFMN